MPAAVPLVNYLVIDGEQPHLKATECESCGARYLGARIACSRCSSRNFVERPLATTGTIGSFTIVHRAAPSIKTPFVSAIVDLDDGTSVKANIIDCDPDPEHVRLGMRTVLRTFEAGRDREGTAAIGFGFAPAEDSA